MPTYEGRPLPRADEEVVDQGLEFDLGTLISRRQALGAFGVGIASFGLAACGGGSSSTGTSSASSEIPDETAGPYPGDGSNGPNVLAEDGIVRRDIRSSFGSASGTAEGIPMELELTITDLAKGGAPFTGAAVYVWHCDRDGGYSLYSTGVTDQNYLRGVQAAGADGKVHFTSIFPACYAGRWPHIHFEVYPSRSDIRDSSNAIAISQVALPKEACGAVYATKGYEQSKANLSQVSLDGDGVFSDDGGVSQLATVAGNAASGYRVSLTAGIDTATEAGGGSGMPAGGAPPEGGPPAGSGPPPLPSS